MNRSLKRIAYGSAFFIVSFSIIFLFYKAFLKPDPSCVDGIKNQEEEGIDCGTVCGNFCFPESFRDIEAVEEPSFIKIDDSKTSLLVKVQNPNPELAAKEFSYVFLVKNDLDEPIFTVEDKSFIYASEIKYIAAPNLPVKASQVGSVEFVVKDPEWSKSSLLPRPVFVVQNHKVSSETGVFRINGNVLSRESLIFQDVEVMAVFFDESGRQVGVSKTKIDEIGPGEARSFTIIHPEIEKVNLSSTEVFVFAKRL